MSPGRIGAARGARDAESDGPAPPRTRPEPAAEARADMAGPGQMCSMAANFVPYNALLYLIILYYTL